MERPRNLLVNLCLDMVGLEFQSRTDSPMRRISYLPVLLGAALTLAACDPSKPAQDIDTAVNESLRQGAVRSEAAGGWPEAVAGYRTLYQRQPTDPAVAVSYLRALRNAGQADEAVRVGAEALTKNGDNPKILSDYGKARLAAHDAQGALPLLRAAAAHEPNDWSLYSAIGVATDLLGDQAAAQEAYLKALELSPSNPAVTNNLALSLALSGNIDGGIAKIESLGPAIRRLPQTRQSLALLYALKGDVAKAEPLLRDGMPDKIASDNLAYYRQLNAAR
jgi:Flp pilus assembly protein TadD